MVQGDESISDIRNLWVQQEESVLYAATTVRLLQDPQIFVRERARRVAFIRQLELLNPAPAG